jgi:branched-chain amino acid transport system permease protein
MVDFLLSPYAVHLYTVIVIYLVLAQGFNIVIGLGRLFNLAHISSYALGAYTATLLIMDAQWDALPAMLAAAVIAGIFALFIGAISVRLVSDYFAIGTLAFSAIVSALLINMRSVTRGVLGIPGIPRPQFFGVAFESNEAFLLLCAIVASVLLLISYCLLQGSYGRALRAIGEFEIGAESLGFDSGGLRLWGVVFASASAGLVGALFSFYLSFIDPSSFSLTEMILVITIVVVGRPGSFWGVVASTIGLILVPEALRFIDIPSSVLGPARQALYAGILFAFVWINRARLFPEGRKV